MVRSIQFEDLDESAAGTTEISTAQVRERIAPTPHGAAAAAQPPQIPLAPLKRVQAKFNPLADGLVYLVVFLGGMVGTAMRYGLSFVLPAQTGDAFWHAFHVSTFVANMLACFVFAWLTSYMSQASWIRKRARQLTSRGVGMGMCGGFSTLSALAVEVLTSLQTDHVAGAMIYLLVSFVGGLLVAWAGANVGMALATKRSARIAQEALSRQHRASGRHVTAGETIVVGGLSASLPRTSSDASRPAPPTGDYGQPLVVHEQGVLPTLPSERDPSVDAAPPSYEPAPITDEIPLTGDPITGEVHG